VGVTPSGHVKANSGVRSGVAAAGKVLEGDDQQIYVHYIMMMMMIGLFVTFVTAFASIYA